MLIFWFFAFFFLLQWWKHMTRSEYRKKGFSGHTAPEMESTMAGRYHHSKFQAWQQEQSLQITSSIPRMKHKERIGSKVRLWTPKGYAQWYTSSIIYYGLTISPTHVSNWGPNIQVCERMVNGYFSFKPPHKGWAVYEMELKDHLQGHNRNVSIRPGPGGEFNQVGGPLF